jgi:ATP-dependent DNA ligase
VSQKLPTPALSVLEIDKNIAHFIADGAIVYRQACALGCEGIVSKRRTALGGPIVG